MRPSPTETTGANGRPVPPGGPRAVHVLLVEDNPGDARLVEHLLADSDKGPYRIDRAETLAKARTRLAAGLHDVVLLDLSLPDSHGMETIRAIQAVAPGLPIVVLTGLADEAFGVEAVQQGAQDYLIKGEGDGTVIARSLAYAIERKQASEELRASQHRYRSLVDMAPDAILVHRDGAIAFVNRAALEMFGADVPADLVGRHLLEFGPTDAPDQARACLCDGNGVGCVDGRLRRLDGVVIDVEATGRPIDFRGAPAVQLVVRDVTERRRATEELRLAAAVFETASEGILVTDATNRIKAVNPAFTRITGFAEDEVIGRDPHVLSSGRHDAEFYADLWNTLTDTGHWQGEVWNRRKDGEVYPEWLSISAMRDGDGRVRQYVAVFTDITERKRGEEQIKRQANFDALTELPNRTLFFDRLSQALATCKRERRRLALLFVDLDKFKAVNDTMGHLIGDRLLEQAAVRLRNCVRAADTVARLGGDEFTVILHDIGSTDDAAIVAEKVIKSLSEPFVFGADKPRIGASIGIAVYPNDGGDAMTMLRNADDAMYRAKEGGRNIYRFFTQEMDGHALKRVSRENDLRRALEHGQFTLHFQPMIELQTGTVAGLESLVRWRHPRRGLILPGEFVPLAEEMGLIGPLGDWILRHACTRAREWVDAGATPLRVAVNLSGRQLRRGLTPHAVATILAETGLAPDVLSFEVTEAMLLTEDDEAAEWLSAVKTLGVGLALDDFGIGMSSLALLQRFPVDTVKIDHAVVRDLNSRGDARALVGAIVHLARGLALTVVAEGVETAGQLDVLRDLGCDWAQGFHLAEPLPGAAVLEALKKGRQGMGVPEPS